MSSPDGAFWNIFTSDNGSQFVSAEFHRFAAECGFEYQVHITLKAMVVFNLITRSLACKMNLIKRIAEKIFRDLGLMKCRPVNIKIKDKTDPTDWC